MLYLTFKGAAFVVFKWPLVSLAGHSTQTTLIAASGSSEDRCWLVQTTKIIQPQAYSLKPGKMNSWNNMNMRCYKYSPLTRTFSCGNQYKVQLRLMELSWVLQVLGDNPKHWTMWNFDDVRRKEIRRVKVLCYYTGIFTRSVAPVVVIVNLHEHVVWVCFNVSLHSRTHSFISVWREGSKEVHIASCLSCLSSSTQLNKKERAHSLTFRVSDNKISQDVLRAVTVMYVDILTFISIYFWSHCTFPTAATRWCWSKLL